VLRDLDALKKSNLPQQMSSLINKVPATSHIVEKFRTSCNFDTEILHITDGVVACLTQKLKNMQDDLNMAIIKLTQGYRNAKSRQMDSTHMNREDFETDSTSPSQYNQIPEDLSQKNKDSLTEPLLGNNRTNYGEESKEHLKDLNELKKVEREDKINKEQITPEFIDENQKIFLNPFDKKNMELEMTEKHKRQSQEEQTKEDGTEQLKKFAASLVLKAERKARGEEYTSNGGETYRERERNDLRKELSGGSSHKDIDKQEKSKINHDHLRVSKKITKPKRFVKQRETEPKLGKYLDGQKKQLIKEKLNARDAWSDLKLFGEIGKDLQSSQDEVNRTNLLVSETASNQ